ncbi:MAG: agmatine deiminase family protein [Erythrobacter sp.]|uniref:agmatine deiminase family protein n=1 Tax=Erythrobacter sp. TaxID=1042 RepID=UPI0026357D86|nr:agmatine deiminase family protein [Erythrobacter sp.]MDJ0978336.1 agmatine deiminase family protein [Erythrobacter sp.]
MPKLLTPPEWAPQEWLWIGFPHLTEEWPGYLEAAQQQIARFASAVADSGQAVRLLVRGEANEERARALVSSKVTLEQRVYGDIWLRDTGPLVVFEDGQRVARRFGFNGWGGKYEMPGDATIGAQLAKDAGLAIQTSPMILEGGAIDTDGTGCAITTEQCLLEPNRNPAMTQDAIEAELFERLGFDRVVWLGKGLVNDHTDGHVDNLARFVAPGRVVVPEASGADDPNAPIYADAAVRAVAAELDVVRIPSPGRIERGGAVEPASYVNFAITTHLVVVPTFGTAYDADGVAAIAALFADRDTIGLPAEAVLAGGGGFHCASQHMPLAPERPFSLG